MLIFPRPWRRRKELDDISSDQKQAWVDDLITRPHELIWYPEDPSRSCLMREVSFPMGSSLVTATVSEVIEFGPPSRWAGRGIDFTNLPFLPICVCHGSGKNVTVYTLEELEQELARQPQCYGPTPKGPWYGSFADPWPYPWQPGNGVFTPFPKSPGDDSPPWGEGMVYATRGLTYPEGEWGHAPWELFQLRGRAEDTQLLDARDVIKCQQYPQDAARYLSTNRWFIDEHGRDLCAQSYEQNDVRGLGFELPAPSREPPGLPCAPQPTPKATRKYYPDDAVLKGEYLRVYTEQTNLQGSSVSLATVGRNMMPPLKPRTLRRYLKTLGIHHPPQ